MKTKTFLSNTFKSIEEYDQAVELYGSMLEEQGYVVETAASCTALPVPQPSPIRGQMDISIHIIASTRVTAFLEDDDGDEEPETLPGGVPRLELPTPKK